MHIDRPGQDKAPEMYLVLGPSAITYTERGEIVETVEWAKDGTPDWTNAGICDPRGTSFDAFADLCRSLESAERNYEFVFGEKPERIPDEVPAHPTAPTQ